jgi:hypothetical protein
MRKSRFDITGAIVRRSRAIFQIVYSRVRRSVNFCTIYPKKKELLEINKSQPLSREPQTTEA